MQWMPGISYLDLEIMFFIAWDLIQPLLRAEHVLKTLQACQQEVLDIHHALTSTNVVTDPELYTSHQSV
jgi:hypothetical protein